MRFCKFCNNFKQENDFDHWCKNGQLKPACRRQREDFRTRNREQIRQVQNETYRTKKRKLPTLEERLQIAQKLAISKNGKCLSSVYKNCKTPLLWFCNFHFYSWFASWLNVKSSNTWCPKCGQVKREKTWLKKYGVTNPTKNPKIRLKGAKKANLITEILHWQTKKPVLCQGSYEVAVCKYLNELRIPYMTQIPFQLSNGVSYSVDFYLPVKDIYVEVKGYMYEDAELKWQLFTNDHKNSELWDTNKLKELNII